MAASGALPCAWPKHLPPPHGGISLQTFGKCSNAPPATCCALLVRAKGSLGQFGSASWASKDLQVLEQKLKDLSQREPEGQPLSSKAVWQEGSEDTKGHVRLNEESSHQSEQGPRRKDYFFKRHLVVDSVAALLRPLLERVGLTLVVSPHGGAKASFVIVKQEDLADGAGDKPVVCLPVCVKASHFARSSGQDTFSRTKDHPGLVILVQLDNRPGLPKSSLWDSFLAAYVLTGSSIVTKSISLRVGAPSKYAPHRLGAVEDLGSTAVDFASKTFEAKERPLTEASTLMKGEAVLFVRDVLPLPLLQQAIAPTSERYMRGMEAYDAFFGVKGLLATPKLQGLLKAHRREGARSGLFTLHCNLKSGPVQLRAFGHIGTLFTEGSVPAAKFNRVPAGEVEITVCFTPRLKGFFLLPEFALAQGRVRSPKQAPGTVLYWLRPYGGGGEKAREWNRFLVDCTGPEALVYARCHAILTLAAKGKAKGWESMPPLEELGLASVTLPLPPAIVDKASAKKEQKLGS